MDVHNIWHNGISYAVQVVRQEPITMKATKEEVMKIVCNYYNLSQDELRSRTRTRPIARARQMYMYLARLYTTASYSQIGSLVDRDHATVLYAFAKHDGYLTNEEQKEVNFLSAMVENEPIEANEHLQMYTQFGRFYRITLAPDFAWGIAGLR